MNGYYSKGVFSTANRSSYDVAYDAGTYQMYFNNKVYEYTWAFNLITYSL